MEKMTTVKLPDGRALEFPLLTGSMGPEVIDIRTLYAKSGMFTYDPGYLSTASCSSAITFIDGDAGMLLYRGYPNEQLARLYQAFRRDAHPMAVMVGVVGALSAFYHDALDISNPQHRTISAFRLIAKMPTIVAMSHKYSVGQPFIYPRNDLVLLGRHCEHHAHEVGRGVQGQRR